MEKLQTQVEKILSSPRIRDRLVVLCEGDPFPIDAATSAPSPQMYRRLEKTPDANFYKACIPRDWHGTRLPQFFTCGGRSDVIRTFEELLAAHNRRPGVSYLNPAKLYAMVDLDIQPNVMPGNYPWQTTEDVHGDLYDDGRLRAAVSDEHRIWVTALIHKEAYFVGATAERAWAGGVRPFFDGSPLRLGDVYVAAAKGLVSDADVSGNIEIVRARLGRFSAGSILDASSCQRLGDSWIAASDGVDSDEYDRLVAVLLGIAKIKPLWSRVYPDPSAECMLSSDTFREQLGLMVAGQIAELRPDMHPLAGFFYWLKSRR